MGKKHSESEFREYLREVGARIRRLRTERGLSTEAAAELAGISPGYWGLVERAVKQPSLNSLFLVASALGVSVVDIVGVGPAREVQGQAAGSAQRWLEGVLAQADEAEVRAIRSCAKAILAMRAAKASRS